MAAYDIDGIFDILSIKRTDLLGDALNTIVAFFDGQKRDIEDPISADPDEDESGEYDWWQHYGFLSRPPSGAEALVVHLGAQAFAIASRALDAVGFGKLNDGDVALYSIGKNVIRLNANGSISMMAPNNKGKQMIVRLDPKGSISLLLGNGSTLQMDEDNGITLLATKGNITLACPGGNIQMVGLGVVNESPTIKLNAAAGAPLAAPNVKPNPGIFV